MNFAACCKRIKLPIGHIAMRCQARAVFRFLIDFRVTNRQRQRQWQRGGGRERAEQCCWDMHGTCETCDHRNQNSSGIEKTQRERKATGVVGRGETRGKRCWNLRGNSPRNATNCYSNVSLCTHFANLPQSGAARRNGPEIWLQQQQPGQPIMGVDYKSEPAAT